MHYYHAFGLNIKSELELPELLSLQAAAQPIDVSMKLGEVSPSGLSEVVASGAFYQANHNAFWLHVPNIAYYLVENGQTITISPCHGSDADSIRVFLLGSTIGALLMQRNMLLLHGNAIKVGEHCVSFLGQSGVGKSTLSGAFMQRGYRVLADDVCVVNDASEVIPGFPHIKLWADARQKLGFQAKACRRIRPKLEKFSVSLASAFYPKPTILSAVYILCPHNQNNFELQVLDGMQKLMPLKNNTYRIQYLKGLGKTQTYLKQTGTLASKIRVVRLHRPDTGFKLDELVGVIESDLEAQGILCGG